MSSELDLTTSMKEVTRGTRMGGATCVVFPDARPDCCNRGDVHLADAFIRFDCGCSFTYCRHALLIIYGRVQLRDGICPKHQDRRRLILEGRWL